MPNKQNMIANLYETFAFEKLTISSTAKKLTEAVYNTTSARAKRAIIAVEGAQIRYRLDGTAPTTTMGHLLNPMDILTVIGNANVANFQAIRKGSTNATLMVSYEK